ncbi:hypothetical protein CASFOL_020430 [Castilleja foliolosa]|uniref:Uncharacterized protein n=1 Tax=Castilleja foliolosa TaxID=1961234 RepID=A0ABD3D1K5_9LAMI
MMTMRVDRRRYRKSARRSNSMNFSVTEDQADKKVWSASSSTSSTGYSRNIRRGTYHSRYPDPNYSSPWDDSIAPMPTRIIRASATRKSNLFNNSSSSSSSLVDNNNNTEDVGESGLSEDQNHNKKITEESNLLYINLIATSVEMGPMSFSVVKDSDTSMLLDHNNKKQDKEQQRVSMPGFKRSGSSTYFRPKKLGL